MTFADRMGAARPLISPTCERVLLRLVEHELLDLVEIMNADDESDDVDAVIRSFEIDADRSRLSIALEITALYSDVTRYRVVDCFNPYRWRVTEADFSDVLVSDDHPAAIPFRGRKAELTFRGTTQQPIELAERLREVHTEHVGEYIDLESVTNQPLSKILAGEFGQIAAGPTSLLERYKREADLAGLVTTLMDCGPPRCFTSNGKLGSTWKEISIVPSVMELGESIVVAERFVVSQAQREI